MGQSETSRCGHDGWQAGCPNCERQEWLALQWIGEDVDVARSMDLSRATERQDGGPDISVLAEGWDTDSDWQGA